MTDSNKERLKQLGWGDVLKAPPAITPTTSRVKRLENEILRLAAWLEERGFKEQAEQARSVMWKA